MMQQMLDRDPIAFLPLVMIGVSGVAILASALDYWREHRTARSLAVAGVGATAFITSLYGLLVGHGGTIVLFWLSFWLFLTASIQLGMIRDRINLNWDGTYLNWRPGLGLVKDVRALEKSLFGEQGVMLVRRLIQFGVFVFTLGAAIATGAWVVWTLAQ